MKRSLVAAGGGALLLPQRMPRALALEMLLTGEPIDAERAAAMGLVNRVVDDGGALDAAVELATAIAANGPLAVAATKRIVQRRRPGRRRNRGPARTRSSAPVFTSEDAREGAAAFAERRAPVWKAR